MSAPISPMHSPGPSASDIQSHLYTSFLQASTYDVALRVSGTWDAIYKLHRVVLIQSGFFRSLFTGGFSESAAKLVNIRNGTDEINLIFDDLNITRPAFEVCISRLYGGGPALHVPPNLIPTNRFPLTPPFAGISLPDDIAPGSHPASPRFLLSLLATAIYLSVPAVASQALSLILKTIGPTTVIPYLNFACGKTIIIDMEEAVHEPQAAVGLENIATLIESDGLSASQSRRTRSKNVVEALKPNLLSETKVLEDTPATGSSDEIPDGGGDDFAPNEPVYHYGAVSDKIGEACTCWLTRWANDMLQLETHRSVSSFIPSRDSRARFKSLCEVDVGSTSDLVLPYSVSEHPLIWRRKGLNSVWAAAIISSDNLFVQNERERYNFARAVVELRRQEGLIEDEEVVWKDLFERGVYYVNMSFEDLIFMSQDISPTTERPYVSAATLHSAHWAQSVLRHIITQRSSHVGPSPAHGVSPSPPSHDKELGITSRTVELLTRMAAEERHDELNPTPTSYFPVLVDASARFGDNGTALHTTHTQASLSMEELFRLARDSAQGTNMLGGQFNHSNVPAVEGGYFGIKPVRFSDKNCVQFDPTGTTRWSKYPPYRFSAEFWDVDLLREKSRLHSQTIWYAGSLFNVYVQIVRKKEQSQLGIYLHRQSHVDPIPASSAPCPARPQVIKEGSITGLTSEYSLHRRQPSLPSMLSLTGLPSVPSGSNSGHYSPSIHSPSRSSSPATGTNSGSPPSPPSPPSSPFSSHPGSPTNPATTLSSAPQQAYRDPRSSISAYFSITCANAVGTSQTRFSSSPDVFSVSQSWGWKSSTLRTEDFIEVGSLPVPRDSHRNEKVSLRATVLLGLV